MFGFNVPSHQKSECSLRRIYVKGEMKSSYVSTMIKRVLKLSRYASISIQYLVDVFLSAKLAITDVLCFRKLGAIV